MPNRVLCETGCDTSRNAVQSPYKRHGRPRRLHNVHCARPRSSFCVVETLLRGYCAHTANPLRSKRTPWQLQAMTFVLNMLKVRVVIQAFYTTQQRLLAMRLLCCVDAWDRTSRTSVFCVFLGCRNIDVKTMLWCDRG